MNISSILEYLLEKPRFYYELTDEQYLSIGFILHDLQDLGILESKMEKGEDEKHKNVYVRRFYITDIGRTLLENRAKALQIWE